jgi:hypothetical protein
MTMTISKEVMDELMKDCKLFGQTQTGPEAVYSN